MSAPCDLCGLDVGIKPFVLNAPEKQFQFCCEGCRGIYEMLHDIKEMPAQNGNNQPNKS
ncbi:MAG: metal-binding protein [Dechloromonas sp.]|uniref:Metal-binding protein n=1 Tax=Candidatus Dechloromonas phosphorivorans TaxID=2899244 RepID=A0A935K158_9RHOO|nr:metal-binding protein [Candidatus Dechloromonas phosphorivorans]